MVLTAKREKFIQELLKGQTQRKAYKAAFNCVKMTDKELIERLSKLDQDKSIKIGGDNDNIKFVGTYWDFLGDDKTEPVEDICNPYVIK